MRFQSGYSPKCLREVDLWISLLTRISQKLGLSRLVLGYQQKARLMKTISIDEFFVVLVTDCVGLVVGSLTWQVAVKRIKQKY